MVTEFSFSLAAVGTAKRHNSYEVVAEASASRADRADLAALQNFFKTEAGRFESL